MLRPAAVRPVRCYGAGRCWRPHCGGPGAAAKIRVKVGAKRDGCITAAFAWMAFECGVIAAPLGGGMRSAFTSYDIPNVYVEGYAAVVNKPRVRAYRGPGAPQVGPRVLALLLKSWMQR